MMWDKDDESREKHEQVLDDVFEVFKKHNLTIGEIEWLCGGAIRERVKRYYLP